MEAMHLDLSSFRHALSRLLCNRQLHYILATAHLPFLQNVHVKQPVKEGPGAGKAGDVSMQVDQGVQRSDAQEGREAGCVGEQRWGVPGGA